MEYEPRGADQVGPDHDNLQNPELMPATEINRAEIMHDWLTQGDEIAARTSNPEARAITDFLRSRAVVVEPIRGGFRVADDEAAIANEPIRVQPLVAQDAKLDEYYKGLVENRSSAASYLPGYRLLQLNDSIPTSPVWKGILVLHEGMHAKVHSEEQYDWRDPAEFSRRERDTFIFQSGIMVSVGGEAYQDAFQAKHTELEQGLAEGDGGHISFPGSGAYDERLDDAFGTPLSAQEQATRQTALWINAMFQLFDERYGVERGANEKMQFMRHLYGKSTAN